ncbi:hypothetical protein Clacol_009407 [Clathrus columnatus]|uniref:Uncharacterized protein n=1 Tax=Clathrus columnatus TaxID=1419009 RepID=A0AAV5AN14_9AGAM|nr:hypothetical protein Clacol_009407 [Clathrus columnatus]
MEDNPTRQDEFGIELDSNPVFEIPTPNLIYSDTFQSSFEYDNLSEETVHQPNPNPKDIPYFHPSRTSYQNVPRGLQTLGPNGQPPQQDVAPPLLPAFLITGLLLGAIVCIIIWRHFTERRRRALGFGEDGDPVDIWGGGDAAEGVLEKPKIWEVLVSMFSEGGGKKSDDSGVDSSLREKWKGWESVMPLSATPFFIPTKRLPPRYLVPSDRPTTFMTRMFGGALEGYRFRYSSASRMGAGAGGPLGHPLMSTIAPTNQLGMRLGVSDTRGGYDPEMEPDTDTFSKGLNSQDEQIEKVQLSFTIAMPSEHRSFSKLEERRMLRARRRQSGGGSSKSGNDGGCEREGGGEKDTNLNAGETSVSIPIEEEWRLPELCLGSLTIPYG